MYNILRVENRVKTKPLVYEGSPFILSPIPEKTFSKRGDYKGAYFLYESFERRQPGEKYYSLHTWQRDAAVYSYNSEYFAIVNDCVICHYPDINGHRDLSYEVFKRTQTLSCGKEMPDESLFAIELIPY